MAFTYKYYIYTTEGGDKNTPSRFDLFIDLIRTKSGNPKLAIEG